MTPAQILDMLRTIFALVLAFIPVEQIRRVLDEEAIKRANAVADVAETAKFGGSP